ncbi:MAG: tRNA lysidine(34) synthetase TilS [Acidimicrobiia bacterium]|nr:tRNA lysidine(34) synthetase TilS [Acidimicrobiia bacterium]
MASSGELDPSLERAGEYLVGRSCVVALSGGPDSAALAFVAHRFGRSTRAIHVDHGQPASAALAAAAEKIAGEIGIPFAKVFVEVPEGASFEDQARRVRYEALLNGCDDGEVLLTGHTADDNAETFVLNLLRGAGLTGLGGIPMERGPVLRPLLDVPRSVVAALVESEGLSAMADPSNDDLAFSRNRIRHEVLPMLGPPEVIARAARLASDDDHALDGLAADVPIRVTSDRVSIPVAALRTVPRPIGSRVIRRGLRQVNPPYPGTSRMIDAVWSVATGATGRAELGEGVIAYVSQACVVIEQERDEPPRAVDLAVPRTVFGDWVLSVSERADLPPALPIGPGYAVFADPPELVVRTPVPGDRVPLRQGGHKDLADVFAEAHISQDGRRNWPVVVTDELVWWVPGVRQGWVGWGDTSSDRYLIANILLEG